MSIAITIPMTVNAYQVASTEVARLPTRCVITRHAMKQLATTRIAASASAPRCSALPCPYWWATSAGRTATPTAKNVSSAATRSVPECAASETRPRLCDARPAPSFTATSAAAASTETRAVRRCGLTAASETKRPAAAGSVSPCHLFERPDDDVLSSRVVQHRLALERDPVRWHRVQVDRCLRPRERPRPVVDVRTEQPAFVLGIEAVPLGQEVLEGRGRRRLWRAETLIRPAERLPLVARALVQQASAAPLERDV